MAELMTAGEKIWMEFKSTLLPYIIAAVVVTVLITEHRRTVEALAAMNSQLAVAVANQGEELGNMRDLLATQGFVSVPTDGNPTSP